MPATPEPVVGLTVGGMNDSVHPLALQITQVARMVNCQVKDQLITTRPGIMSHPLEGAVDEFKESPCQGGIYYNPIRGQSQQLFGADRDSLVIAAGGKLFHVTIGPNGTPVLSNVTGDAPQVGDAHLVHLYQLENYAVAQDGYSRTWIWDGRSTAFPSPGFNEDRPLDSWLANAATVGGYAHGRAVQVIGGNRIIIGDIIHSNGQDDPVAALRMSEQIYYATGSSFSPPSNMGEVLAFGILPLSNTAHGHDSAVFHCRRGCFTIKLDHFPRLEWVNIAASKVLLIDAAATGPYALMLHDGDQLFRSRHGIQAIRSAASDTSIIGNPLQPMSEPVGSFMKADHHSLLRFTSMARWAYNNRVLCTTGMWVDGAWRGGSGIVALNLNSDGSMRGGEEQRCWEGLWTLPQAMGLPSQLVAGQFQDEDRVFAVTAKRNGEEYESGLAEIMTGLEHDVLESGECVPISSQVITAEVTREGVLSRCTLSGGLLMFDKVSAGFKWGVWVRNHFSDPWMLWQSGGVECNPSPDIFKPEAKTRLRVNLSDGPDAKRRGPRFQFLIRWLGYGQLVGLNVNLERTNAPNERPDLGMESLEGNGPCDYDDYEYAKGTTWDQEL